MTYYMDRRRNRKSETIREGIKYVLTVVCAFALAFCFVYFILQIDTVVGDSMSPTLKDQDKVLLNKCAYTFTQPKRYDVIKFKITKSKTEHKYIKRVIGLPEETVQIKDGMVYINGKKLEDAPFEDFITSAGIADKEFTLEEDEYFVMGDNCNNSEDSRYANIGAVTKEEIAGRISAKWARFHLSGI